MSVLLRSRTRLDIPGLLTRVFRSKGGLFFPEYDTFIQHGNNALALLRGPRFGGGALLIPATNIVTTAGNVNLAQLAVAATVTNAFTYWEQASAASPDTPTVSANRSNFTPIGSSAQVQTSGYPKVSDPDTDNTGSGATVRSTATLYTAASFNNSAISHAYITNAALGGSEPIFAAWKWSAAINKTSSDTLKCFHNATILGS